MVRKLVYRLPLRKCKCGGEVFLWRSGRKTWEVSCLRYGCNRLEVKMYRSPLMAVIMWNLRDWNYTKRNKQLFEQMKGE